MARGNQRDKAREANQKKACPTEALEGSVANADFGGTYLQMAAQKSGTQMSGTEMQREREKVAEKMRQKQLAGMCSLLSVGFLNKEPGCVTGTWC